VSTRALRRHDLQRRPILSTGIVIAAEIGTLRLKCAARDLVGPWRHPPGTLRALIKTIGAMYVICRPSLRQGCGPRRGILIARKSHVRSLHLLRASGVRLLFDVPAGFTRTDHDHRPHF